MNNEEKIRSYFSGKQKSLLAISQQDSGDHPSLTGSHREKIINTYFNEILPTKFSTGNGIIYGDDSMPDYKSKEADILIWNSHDFSDLKLYDYSIYFSNSVYAVIEVKSNWSTNTFNDIKEKSSTIKRCIQTHQKTLEDDVFIIQNLLQAHIKEKPLPKFLAESHKIGFISIIFKGGNSFDFSNFDTENIESQWPDIMFFLDAGKVVYKQYLSNSDGMIMSGELILAQANDDSLLLFTELLLEMLNEKSGHRNSFTLFGFLNDILKTIEIESFPFEVRKNMPGLQVLPSE